MGCQDCCLLVTHPSTLDRDGDKELLFRGMDVNARGIVDEGSTSWRGLSLLLSSSSRRSSELARRLLAIAHIDQRAFRQLGTMERHSRADLCDGHVGGLLLL
jgi:hypothetical protein